MKKNNAVAPVFRPTGMQPETIAIPLSMLAAAMYVDYYDGMGGQG